VSTELRATAIVSTDRAERYAKQLGEHLGRKVPLTVTPEGRLVRIAGGTCLLSPTADALVLQATAPDAESLARVQDVVGRHLERFGARDELQVTWVAA
jgi:uncharacterized protein